MRIDIGDILVLAGTAALLTGLYFFDWRLSLIAAGILLLFTGAVRLLYNHNMPE